MRGFFKRRNSFGILYLGEEKADVDEVFDVLARVQVPIRHVYGIQTIGLKRIVVKLNDEESELFERTMRDYEDRVFSLENRNVNVKIVNLSTNKIVVTIRNAPFELPNHMLQDILSEYGQVFNVRSQVYQEGKLAGISNGNKTALMALKKPIPSSLVYGNLVLLIHYRDQVRTCHKCGLEGHLAAHCVTQENEAVNRISKVDFPELKKGNVESEISDDNQSPPSEDIVPTDNQSPPSEDIVPTENEMLHSDPVPKETEASLPIIMSPVAESEAEDDRRPINASPDGFQEHVVNADIHGDKANAAAISETPSVDHSETDDVIGNTQEERMEIGSSAVKPKILQPTLTSECGMKECSLETINEKISEDIISEPPLEENKLSVGCGTSDVLPSSSNVFWKGEKDVGNLENNSPRISKSNSGWQTVFKNTKEDSIVKRGYNMRRNVRESKGKISAEKRKCLAISDKMLRDPVKSSKLHDNFHINPKQGMSKFNE